jgi:hypothetical protein
MVRRNEIADRLGLLMYNDPALPQLLEEFEVTKRAIETQEVQVRLALNGH